MSEDDGGRRCDVVVCRFPFLFVFFFFCSFFLFRCCMFGLLSQRLTVVVWLLLCLFCFCFVVCCVVFCGAAFAFVSGVTPCRCFAFAIPSICLLPSAFFLLSSSFCLLPMCVCVCVCVELFLCWCCCWYCVTVLV